MAKKSMIAREVKRKNLVKKLSDKRLKLKETIRDPSSTYDQKEIAQLQLQKMPRPTRSKIK